MTSMTIKLLTKNAISDMFSKRMGNWIVQILEIEEIDQAGRKLSAPRVTISDGHSKEIVFFVNNASFSLKNASLQKNSIIRIHDLIHAKAPNTKVLLFILNFETIYLKVDEMIGVPVDYTSYKAKGSINVNGSIMIPSKYYNEESNSLFTTNSIEKGIFTDSSKEEEELLLAMELSKKEFEIDEKRRKNGLIVKGYHQEEEEEEMRRAIELSKFTFEMDLKGREDCFSAEDTFKHPFLTNKSNEDNDLDWFKFDKQNRNILEEEEKKPDEENIFKRKANWDIPTYGGMSDSEMDAFNFKKKSPNTKYQPLPEERLLSEYKGPVKKSPSYEADMQPFQHIQISRKPKIESNPVIIKSTAASYRFLTVLEGNNQNNAKMDEKGGSDSAESFENNRVAPGVRFEKLMRSREYPQDVMLDGIIPHSTDLTQQYSIVIQPSKLTMYNERDKDNINEKGKESLTKFMTNKIIFISPDLLKNNLTKLQLSHYNEFLKMDVNLFEAIGCRYIEAVFKWNDKEIYHEIFSLIEMKSKSCFSKLEDILKQTKSDLLYTNIQFESARDAFYEKVNKSAQLLQEISDFLLFSLSFKTDKPFYKDRFNLINRKKLYQIDLQAIAEVLGVKIKCFVKNQPAPMKTKPNKRIYNSSFHFSFEEINNEQESIVVLYKEDKKKKNTKPFSTVAAVSTNSLGEKGDMPPALMGMGFKRTCAICNKNSFYRDMFTNDRCNHCFCWECIKSHPQDYNICWLVGCKYFIDVEVLEEFISQKSMGEGKEIKKISINNSDNLKTKGPKFFKKMALDSSKNPENLKNESNALKKSSKAKPLKNKNEDSFLCKICFDNKIEIVFIKCGHANVCESCVNLMKKKECPFCQKEDQYIKVFI